MRVYSRFRAFPQGEPNIMVDVVTEYLKALVARQVDDNGLVVWYDPERAYAAATERLDLRDTTVARYAGSFFRLRHQIDHLLDGLQPPRLVVYVPEDQGRTHHALIELEVAGVVIQPGQQPPQRNTRLSIVARNALRPFLGDDTAAEVEKQVESGKLSLADLNTLAEKGKDIGKGVVALIFGSGNSQEVALSFLASNGHDAEVEKKDAAGELSNLLRFAFDCDLPATAPLVETRDRLARHILMTDLAAGLGDAVPSALASVKVAISAGPRDACMTLARTWRLRRDARDSYMTAARKVEQSLGPLSVVLDPWGPETKDKGPRTKDLPETFPFLERALIRHVESALIDEATPAWLALAQSRLSRFWSEWVPAIQAHWALVAAAAEVLLEADRVPVRSSPPLRPSRPSSKPMPRVTPPGVCSTPTTATWRPVGPTSSPTPAIRTRAWIS